MLGEAFYNDFSTLVSDWNTLEKTLQDNNILASVQAYDVDNVIKCEPNIDIYVLDVERKMFRVHIGAATQVMHTLGLACKGREWMRTVRLLGQKIEMGCIAHEDLKSSAELLAARAVKAERMREDAIAAYEKSQTLVAVLNVNMMFEKARCIGVMVARTRCMSLKNLSKALTMVAYLSAKSQ